MCMVSFVTLLRWAGVSVVIGSVVFLVVPFLTPGLYQLSPEERVSYVLANRSVVVTQNTLLAAAGIAVAVGFALWSLHAKDHVNGVLNWSAAIVLVLSAIALAVFFFQTTKDPESYYLAEAISPVGTSYFVLASLAFALYGLLFIQAGTGNWLGYLSIVAGVLMLIALLAIGGKDLPPQPFFLVSLTAGIVFLINAPGGA